MAEDIQNLGDILRKLRDSSAVNGDGSRPDEGYIYREEPEELCSICGNRRWLTVEVPVGHPEFGKAQPCQCQVETSAGERESRLRRYANLGPLSRRTFGSTNPNGRAKDPETMRLFGAAYEASLAYAEQPSGWLVLTGPNGSGKTHLAAAIANHCIENGRPVFFVHVPDLLDDLRSTYAPASEMSYSELFEQVNDTPLLVLDGLGTQSPTPWAQEKLQQIFNRRANAELPTVVTTAADVSEIDPYIASRMTNSDLTRVLAVGNRVQGPAKQLGSVPEEMLSRMTFQTFDTRGNNPSAAQRASLQAAFDAAKHYASYPDGWLCFFGHTGVGKTHLAVAIAGERLKQGKPVLFAPVPRLLDHLRGTFDEKSRFTYGREFEKLQDAPMLILDDLGIERQSDWAYEKLYQLFVHRHDLRLSTVITTHINLIDVGGTGASLRVDTGRDASILSRMKDKTVVSLKPIDVPDFRPKKGGRRRG